MPFLKLSTTPHHDTDRPSLRERAAGLRAGLARIACRPAPQEAPKPIAPAIPASGLALADDAPLIALEAEFLATDAALAAAAAAASEAKDACVLPDMPVALRVWSNDWWMDGIPRTPMDPLPDGRARMRPYGEREVEIMRTTPCTKVGFGTEGEPLPGGGRLQPDRMAQARADAIVAAWDAWQAEVTAAKEAASLPALVAAMKAAREVRNVVLQRVRETPARGLAGLAIKARIAANLACKHDLGGAGLELFEPDDGDGFLYALAGDVLALTGGLPAAHRLED